jgi:tetratricopeptide (TPR) repeat protein
MKDMKKFISPCSCASGLHGDHAVRPVIDMKSTLTAVAACAAFLISACAPAPEPAPRISRIALRAKQDTGSTSREQLARRADRARAELERNPGDHSSVVALGDILLRQARATGHGGRAVEAERMLSAALVRDPEHHETRRLLAATYLSLHKFRDALREGTRCLSVQPKDADAYGIVGDAHLELGEYDQAFTAFDRMNELKPTAASYARASYARELQGDLPGALDIMKMALDATSPADREALAWHHAQLGHLYVESGRLAEASREYLHADYVFPGYPMAADGLARVASESGRHEEALAIVQKRLGDAPVAGDFALAGNLLHALGRSDDAERSYRLAEAAWRSDTPEPAQFARFLADRAGRADEAVRVAEAAIAERRDIFTADALAWAYFRAGRLEDAHNAMADARRTGTRDRDILRHSAAMGYAGGHATTLAQR